MGYEYQEKFVDKANEILANQMKAKPEWIDRKVLIKALESDFNTDWADYASKNNFDKDYIDGVRDEYDDVLTIICKQRNLADEELEIYNNRIEAEAVDVQPVKHGKWIGDEVIQCSNCNFTLNGASYGRIVHKYFNYCPNAVQEWTVSRNENN